MVGLAGAVTVNIKRMLKVNLNIGAGEHCLVLNDLPNASELTGKSKIALKDMFDRTLLALKVFKICKRFLTDKTDFMTFISRGVSGAEPPRDVAEAMRNYDAILMLTTHSLSHTDARRGASNRGARIASMPGFNVRMLYPNGPMDVDYLDISRQTKVLAEIGSEARRIRIESADGTEFIFEKGSRPFIVDDGLYASKGRWGNLPAGEAYCAPIEGQAYGKLCVKKGWYPNLGEDMQIIVADGLVGKVVGGGGVGNFLRRILGFGKEAPDNLFIHRRNIAEFGVGTNPNAKRPDNILEAEKIKGTVHVALGDNIHFGGMNAADIHLDFVYPYVSVWFDDRKIIDEGSWLI